METRYPTSEQRNILKKLNLIKELNNYDFYLAGGVGLAFYLSHRLSMDLDFFSNKHFESNELYEILRKKLNAKIIKIEKETLIVSIDNIPVSFFGYNYPVLKIENFDFPTASLEDIGCMKISAIAGRGMKKDFVDLYEICQKIDLEYLLRKFEEKYSEFAIEMYHILKSMIYFEDAETDVVADADDKYWGKIKGYFIGKVQEIIHEFTRLK